MHRGTRIKRDKCCRKLCERGIALSRDSGASASGRRESRVRSSKKQTANNMAGQNEAHLLRQWRLAGFLERRTCGSLLPQAGRRLDSSQESKKRLELVFGAKLDFLISNTDCQMNVLVRSSEVRRNVLSFSVIQVHGLRQRVKLRDWKREANNHNWKTFHSGHHVTITLHRRTNVCDFGQGFPAT